MDWPQVLTVLVVVVVTNLGTIIALYLHLDTKTNKTIEEGRKETNDIIRAIQQEMKDFHGRLCAIEERNKKA